MNPPQQTIDSSTAYLKHKVDKLRNQNNELKEEVTELKTKHGALETSHEALEIRYENLKKKFGQLEEKLENVTKTIPENIGQNVENFSGKLNFVEILFKQLVFNVAKEKAETLRQEDYYRREEKVPFKDFSAFDLLIRGTPVTAKDLPIKDDFARDVVLEILEKINRLEQTVVNNENNLATRFTDVYSAIEEESQRPLNMIKKIEDTIDTLKEVLLKESSSQEQNQDYSVLRGAVESLICKYKSLKLRVGEVEKDVVDRDNKRLMKIKELEEKVEKLSTPHDVVKYCQFEKIIITSNDYKCLASSEFLNDVIIDFTLQHLKTTNTIIRDKVHIFGQFFYNSLVTSLNDDKVNDRLKNWTKKVDIFEKDYIVIPVLEQSHWYLLIVCHPGNMERTLGLENKDDVADDKKPCILVFDSLPNEADDRSAACERIRSFLTSEWSCKRGLRQSQTLLVSETNLPQYNPLVRGQLNSKDCGVFLLQYVESFFTKGLGRNWTGETDHRDLFERKEVNDKRGNIAKLIRDLSFQNKDFCRDVHFPQLNFVPEFRQQKTRRRSVDKESPPAPEKPECPGKREMISPQYPKPLQESSAQPQSLHHGSPPQPQLAGQDPAVKGAWTSATSPPNQTNLHDDQSSSKPDLASPSLEEKTDQHKPNPRFVNSRDPRMKSRGWYSPSITEVVNIEKRRASSYSCDSKSKKLKTNESMD